MSRFDETIRRLREMLLLAAGLTAVALSIAFVSPNAMSGLAPSQNQSPAQNAAPNVPAYEFDVATIKPSRPTSDNGGVAGFMVEDTFRSRNYTFKAIIRMAYGIKGNIDGMVLGGPTWLDSDRYDITAKMDSSVTDKLKALTPDQRELAKERMLQALLADRLKLVIHRETKELPVYALIIAKNGPKLKESKPGDTYEKAFPYADKFADSVKAGTIFGVGGGASQGRMATMTQYCFAVSTFALARQLTFWTGRTVQDKTGLKGSYDFTLKWWFSPAPSGSSAAASNDQSVPAASDPAGGPDLFAAIQQQLGLKLESGKGPVEIVVIDHVERPSGN